MDKLFGRSNVNIDSSTFSYHVGLNSSVKPITS